MAKIKLTPRQRDYYRKLFQEDKNYYTVVDQLAQLPMLAGKLEGAAETLGFIEFLSGIFHIVWTSDVYDRNHRRLMDILIGFQYAIEFDHDKEAADTMALLLARFKERFAAAEARTEERVIAAQKLLVARYKDSIPGRDTLEKESAFFLRLSRPYVVEFAAALAAGDHPAWPPSRRHGITLDPLTYDAVHAEPALRLDALTRRLGE